MTSFRTTLTNFNLTKNNMAEEEYDTPEKPAKPATKGKRMVLKCDKPADVSKRSLEERLEEIPPWTSNASVVSGEYPNQARLRAMKVPKFYLGDAVYAEFTGYHIVLTTEDGICETNRICLEPNVIDGLNSFIERLRIAINNHTEESPPQP